MVIFTSIHMQSREKVPILHIYDVACIHTHRCIPSRMTGFSYEICHNIHRPEVVSRSSTIAQEVVAPSSGDCCYDDVSVCTCCLACAYHHLLLKHVYQI